MFGFILRNHKLGLVYDGSVKTLDSALDQDDAIAFYHDDRYRHHATTRVFGQKLDIKLPIIKRKDYDKLEAKPKDMTKEFRDYLVAMARMRMLSDTEYGIRDTVMKSYDIVQLKNKQLLFLVNDTKTSKLITSFDREREGALILMKEELDGYTFTEDYKLAIGGEEKQFPIGSDYIIKHPTTLEELVIKGNYGAALRNAIFGRAVEISGIKDKPLLYAWQYDLLKRMGKRTCFTHIRRAGKTIFMALASLMFLLKDNDKRVLRPTSVLYLSLAEKNIQAVVHYLLKMKESFGEIGDQMFHYDSKYNVFSFRQGRKILGTITFISQFARDPGVGNFVDALIVDEAPRIKYEVFKDFEPFITHENASFLAGSTMYEGVEKSRFYDYLLEYEKESLQRYDIDKFILDQRALKLQNPKHEMDFSTGVRYTIDDDENMTEKQKQALRDKYMKQSPARYLSELYSRFPEEGKVFGYSRALQPYDNISGNLYKYIIVGYDPALTSDLSAIEVVGYNSTSKKLVTLEEHTLNKKGVYSFTSQAQKIKEILSNVTKKYSSGETTRPTYFVMDSTGNQKSTAELLVMHGIAVDLMVSYTSGDYESTSPVPGETRVPKKTLVKISQIIFDNSKAAISNKNTDLIKQLDNFYQIGKNQYEGKGEYDDHVNAMMLANYYAYERLGLKHDLMVVNVAKADDNKYLKRVHNMTQADLIAYNKKDRDAYNELENPKEEESYFSKFIW